MTQNNGLALVPARGGSKRLKHKNIINLFGQPLIYHTLDVLARCFDNDRIIVASDSQKILQTASKHPCDPVLHSLPPETTSDKSTVLDSVCWLVDRNILPDSAWIGLFLPTCPMRTKLDILESVRLLSQDIDGVISTTDYEFPPALGLVKDSEGLLHCYDPSLPWLEGNTQSQDHRGVIRPNGALYIKWTDKFERDRNFYKGRVRNYHMPRRRSIDIDIIEDLRALERRGK